MNSFSDFKALMTCVAASVLMAVIVVVAATGPALTV